MPHLQTASLPVRSAAPQTPPHGEPLPATIEVSVCIANWNCRDLLRDCLASLLHRSQGVRLEVIVVDNASTDGAADMVAREFPQARLIRNTANRGFAAANNQAACQANGNYLLFLNNDTVVPENTLGHLAEFLEVNPDVAMVGPRLVGRDQKPQTSWRKEPSLAAFLHRTWLCRLTGLFRADYRKYRRRAGPPVGPCEVELLLGAAIMLPRGRFAELGGWDEDFAFGGEDMDLSLRARRLGALVYDPRVAIKHIGSVSTRANIAYAQPSIAVGFARYFRKSGASPRQMLLYKTAITLDAPVQVVVKSLQYLWRRCLGRRDAAAKSWNDAKGAAAFLLFGLVPFWKA